MLLLHKHELSVAEIQAILGMTQSRTSGHLAQLHAAGLLRTRRSGKQRFYSTTPEARVESSVLHALLQSAAQELPQAEADDAALRVVLRQRQNESRAFFDQLAGKFGKHYCPGRSWQAFSDLLLELLPPLVIADLGAGEGEVSMLLARRAQQVIAVDSSAKMVEVAQKKALQAGLKNIEFRVGDMEQPPILEQSVDVVVFSQALHHASDPQKTLLAAWEVLKPGGQVLILDLLSHGLEQARDLYADIWLGFGEGELLAMLTAAGFEAVQVRMSHREKVAPHFQTLLASGRRPMEG